MAETENTRRRAVRDRDDAQKYGITNFAREVLAVADNLRRALEAIPSDTLQTDEALKTLYDGIAATERQLEAALGKQQIQRIWPEGERFDSNFHQAMFEVPDSGKPAGTVVQVLQAGYKIHDRLLRPALVGVAKGGPAAANDAAPQWTGGAAASTRRLSFVSGQIPNFASHSVVTPRPRGRMSAFADGRLGGLTSFYPLHSTKPHETRGC